MENYSIKECSNRKHHSILYSAYRKGLPQVISSLERVAQARASAQAKEKE